MIPDLPSILSWKDQDVISVTKFNEFLINDVLIVADKMKDIINTTGYCDIMKGKLMTAFFAEPSTRTQTSFMAAMIKLGGQVIPVNAITSSVQKGETIFDTIKTLNSYSDLIVIRHPQKGSAQIAADSADVPVLNAGDGDGEHPSQALLDMYTIYHRFNKFNDLTITLVGDLKYGRTVHSLVQLLSLYSVTINLVSPNELQLPENLLQSLKTNHKIKVNVSNELDNNLMKQTDVIYMTRIQKERFPNEEDYNKLKDSYILNKEKVLQGKPTLIVMHPLPRVNEISTDVDDLPNNAYFEQMRNGLFVRMALISLVSGTAISLFH